MRARSIVPSSSSSIEAALRQIDFLAGAQQLEGRSFRGLEGRVLRIGQAAQGGQVKSLLAASGYGHGHLLLPDQPVELSDGCAEIPGGLSGR